METYRPLTLDNPRNAHRALRELVMAATVRIHRAGPGYALDEPGTFLGSGFFIAPNWVLTCAHVVHSGEGDEVTVVYEEGPGRGTSAVTGEVAMVLPDRAGPPARGTWPAPDLALVRLREPVDHDCAYVTERPAAYYEQAVVLYSGWSVVGGELRRLSGTCTVQGTLGGWSGDEQIRLGGDVLPPGVSGGPVVDPVRGEVIGVLKSRPDRGLGGTCTGVEQLRSLPVPTEESAAEHDDPYHAVFHAHDRYHRDRQRDMYTARSTWVDVQNQLGARPGRVLRPEERTQLLGRLADLPPPASTRALLGLLESLLGDQAAIPHPAPRGWRDGLGALYESSRQDAALDLVLDYAMRAMSAKRPLFTPGARAAEQALWEWVQQKADSSTPAHRQRLGQQWMERLQARPTAAREGTPLRTHDAHRETHLFVLLELEPRGWEPDRCDWHVSVSRPTGESMRLREGERTPLGELLAVLAAPLTEAFRQCDEPGRPAVLEVRLPHLLHGLDIDAWRLGPGEPPLGTRRPVVMRNPAQEELPDLNQPTDTEDHPFSQRWQASTGEEPDVLDDREPG
ncbi:trypsin-like peptidase domain-containing protein [Streptomyces sp. NPDC020794]|uniref:trypsin-like peptidase domain-containing protein n=1 Tax=unclassified Streptomyces TaxID=2593676 RepID=UPI0036EC8A4C